MTDMLKPVGVSRWVLRAITTLPILGVLAWQCRTPLRWRRDPRVILEFGLVLLAMLLRSERTWKHHATTLPIVYLGVWYVLACVPMSDRLRNWHTRGLIMQIILLQGSTSGIVGDRLADRLLDGGVFCWGLVLCFVQTAWLLGTLHKQTGRKCIAKS